MSDSTWSRSRARSLLGGLGLLLGAALVLGPIPSGPAHAASGDILISQDGITWTTGLNRNIFDTSRMLVPGDSLQGSFYVKNDNAFPAYLRVGLSSLAVTHFALAQALSMTTIGTGSSGASGSAAALSATGVVCSDLLQREDPVPAGGVVLVSADLLFRASTSGSTAQGEIAQIGFIVEFSDVDLNTFGQPLCSNSIVIGPPDPNVGPTPAPTPSPSPDSGGGGGDAGGGSVDNGGGTNGGATGTDGGASDGSAGATGTGIDRPSISSSAGTIAIDGVIGLDTSLYNTVRWWEEYAILILIGAALLGMLGRVYVARWITRREQEQLGDA